jgi:hypothetical protein
MATQILFSCCVFAGLRPVSPFNHEGREAAAITHWRLRSRRQRIEPAALVSGTPQNKTFPHAGRQTSKRIKKILLSGGAAPPGYRNGLHLT